MYKKFRNYIKNLSLVIGYLNLLKSFYCQGVKSKSNKNCKLIDEATLKFKILCKSTIKELENLIEHQQSQINLNIEDLKLIKDLIDSISKEDSHSMLKEVMEGLDNAEEFINFLVSELPNKNLSQIDLRDIKTEALLFKYQVYMA
jgi:hypothetical protein